MRSLLSSADRRAGDADPLPGGAQPRHARRFARARAASAPTSSCAARRHRRFSVRAAPPFPRSCWISFEKQPHVEAGHGRGHALRSNLPLSSTASISSDFNQMSGGFTYLEGGPFQGPDDIIVDQYYAEQKKLHVGRHASRSLNHDWHVRASWRRANWPHCSCRLRPCRTGRRHRQTSARSMSSWTTRPIRPDREQN